MARLHSAACERNRDPILAVLREVLPQAGLVLEIAAGTGMHAAYFAPRFPTLTWLPTDAEDEALASIAAWREDARAENLSPPARLDVTASAWPVERADAIFNANMIHISPFECTEGLLSGAARVLADGAPLVMYGPYKIGGAHTAPSNEAFDQSLRARDPRWGVRDLDAVIALADAAGLAYERRVTMPANNLCVVYRRRARA
ncbi:MAG: DUF938 domain-containing protein [Sandaracinaceae bacterium]|nr:DUF938 domain-containing protein [Sandaracinaceae bacterium]